MKPHALVLVAAFAISVTACTPPQVRYESQPSPARTSGPVAAVLYLVGDAGEVNAARGDVLGHLSRDIASVARGGAGPAVVVAFLGDNIYDEGLPTDPSDEDLAKLDAQVQALSRDRNVQGVFLPGNHDWANGGSLADGRAAIARQSDRVERLSPGRTIRFLPDDGCPGPATLDIGTSLHLVFIDTEWLLRRPEEECGTSDEFYARLTADLAENRDRRVVLMSHHPLVSGGPHGGNVAPFENGPFVYYLAHKSGAGVQDLSSGRYSSVVRELREAIAASGTRPLIHAAGHDHTLQVIGLAGPGDPDFQLVSGAGAKSERSRWVEGMRYATDGFGYMRLDFSDDVTLTVLASAAAGGPVSPVFSCILWSDGRTARCPEAPRADDGR